ncbi:SIR2 family protein [Desulfoluna limicola]|nr:SIR2 family protein [Desulfoluna limicola]
METFIPNILYILGAGFSAPLGIPVMDNFLSKSKDMYSLNSEKYQHFCNIFNDCDRLSKAKNYIASNLFNIEELLSILEMESFATVRNSTGNFKHYIADVIKYYSPIIPKTTNCLGTSFLFGGDLFSLYGAFVASLLTLEISQKEGNISSRLVSKRSELPNYSLISLNYDMIIEDYIRYMESHYKSPVRNIVTEVNENEDNYYHVDRGISFAKIHGSVEPQSIIPPTWNKTNRAGIQKTWHLASNLISNSNYIRFLGYSMPDTDSYIKYLLTVSIVNSENLKGIDVICLDADKTVEKRFRRLFNFNNFRFKNENILRYFESIREMVHRKGTKHEVIFYEFDKLEHAHDSFFT